MKPARAPYLVAALIFAAGIASLFVPSTPSGEQQEAGAARSGRAPVAGQLAATEVAGSNPAAGPAALPEVAAARKEARPATVIVRSPAPVADTGRTPATLSGAMEVPASFANDGPAMSEGEMQSGKLSEVVRSGLASTVGDGFPDDYLALPDGPGVTVRICGAGGCVTRTSTDKGPDQRIFPDRIADLSTADFWTVSHQDWRIVGLTPVSLTIEGRVP